MKKRLIVLALLIFVTGTADAGRRARRRAARCAPCPSCCPAIVLPSCQQPCLPAVGIASGPPQSQAAPAPAARMTESVSETCPIYFVYEDSGTYWHYAEYYNPTCNDGAGRWYPAGEELPCPIPCGSGNCIAGDTDSLAARNALAAKPLRFPEKGAHDFPKDSKWAMNASKPEKLPLETIAVEIDGAWKVIRCHHYVIDLNMGQGEPKPKSIVFGFEDSSTKYERQPEAKLVGHLGQNRYVVSYDNKKFPIAILVP